MAKEGSLSLREGGGSGAAAVAEAGGGSGAAAEAGGGSSAPATLDFNALCSAIERGDIATMRRAQKSFKDLYDQSAADGKTVWHFAAESGNVAALTWLQSSEYKDLARNVTTDNKRTVWHFAAESGNAAALDWLQGAYPKLATKPADLGATALHIAIHYERLHAIEYLCRWVPDLVRMAGTSNQGIALLPRDLAASRPEPTRNQILAIMDAVDAEHNRYSANRAAFLVGVHRAREHRARLAAQRAQEAEQAEHGRMVLRRRGAGGASAGGGSGAAAVAGGGGGSGSVAAPAAQGTHTAALLASRKTGRKRGAPGQG